MLKHTIALLTAAMLVGPVFAQADSVRTGPRVTTPSAPAVQPPAANTAYFEPIDTFLARHAGKTLDLLVEGIPSGGNQTFYYAAYRFTFTSQNSVSLTIGNAYLSASGPVFLTTGLPAVIYSGADIMARRGHFVGGASVGRGCGTFIPVITEPVVVGLQRGAEDLTWHLSVQTAFIPQALRLGSGGLSFAASGATSVSPSYSYSIARVPNITNCATGDSGDGPGASD